MARSAQRRTPKSQLLRANGFRPLPMLWVKDEQFLRILEIAGECKHEYDRLTEIHERRSAPPAARPMTREDEIELAWRSRG